MGASPSVLQDKIKQYGNERNTRLEQFDQEREARIKSHDGARSNRLAKYADDQRKRLDAHEEDLHELDALHDKLAIFEAKLEDHIQRFIMPQAPPATASDESSDKLDVELGIGSPAAGGGTPCQQSAADRLDIVYVRGCQSSWHCGATVDERVLFAAGSVVVLQDAASGDQQFLGGSLGLPIDAIAVSPDTRTVATAASSSNGQLQIEVTFYCLLSAIHCC